MGEVDEQLNLKVGLQGATSRPETELEGGVARGDKPTRN
jgi:hypothetical protein